MKAPANCSLIGRWRIVEADLWDRAHLDLCGPAMLTITAQRRRNRIRRPGGRSRSRMRPRLNRLSLGRLRGRRRSRGRRNRELLDDGTLEIEFEYRNGDEAVLKAKPDTSSTAC